MTPIWIIIALAGLVAIAAAASPFDAREFGVAGDGQIDETAALQKALDAAAEAGGGTTQLGVGSFRLDGSVTVPSGVTLAGVWEAPHHAQLQRGTVFHVYAGKGEEEGALINLQPSSAIRGCTFFYPEQRLPDPAPYPWTIQGSGMHGSVIDVTLVNAWKGIDFGTHHHELHYVRNVFGCPLKIGVHLDNCTDIGRVENVHFNPHYWMRAEVEGIPTWEQLRDWLFGNCTAFEIGRSDWEYMFNTFSYGCAVGYRFFAGERGPTNGNFLGIAADWSKTCILVEQTQEPGLLITNGQFVGGTGCETVIDVRPEHTGVVQLSNCSFWGPHERIARIAGTGHVSLNQCNFVHWDRSKAGVPAIEALGGDLTIQASRFNQRKAHLRLGPDILSAAIFGNHFVGGPQIDNQSSGDVQIGLNTGR